jgi:hypothetical protein
LADPDTTGIEVAADGSHQLVVEFEMTDGRDAEFVDNED